MTSPRVCSTFFYDTLVELARQFPACFDVYIGTVIVMMNAADVSALPLQSKRNARTRQYRQRKRQHAATIKAIQQEIQLDQQSVEFAQPNPSNSNNAIDMAVPVVARRTSPSLFSSNIDEDFKSPSETRLSSVKSSDRKLRREATSWPASLIGSNSSYMQGRKTSDSRKVGLPDKHQECRKTVEAVLHFWKKTDL